jgi:hypothetical protein
MNPPPEVLPDRPHDPSLPAEDIRTTDDLKVELASYLEEHEAGIEHDLAQFQRLGVEPTHICVPARFSPICGGAKYRQVALSTHVHGVERPLVMAES